MTYKLRRFIFFILIISSFNGLNAQIWNLDTLYQVKITPFLDKVLSIQSNFLSIELSADNFIVPVKETIFAPNGQMLLKDNKDIYINIQQTGFLYKLIDVKDSLMAFRRMDRTININYNIGCYNFIHQGNLFSYGGYGFWKTNGHLRQFNIIDQQWDIIPMNNEIFSNGYRWFSQKTGKLFIPFQNELNAGLKQIPDNILDNQEGSFYLDIKKKEWVKLGVLDPSVKKIFTLDRNPSGFLATENGLLHLIDDEVYFFSFNENKIYKSTKSDFNQFFVRRNGNRNVFEQDGVIYFYYPFSGQFESISFSLSNFELLDFPIWRRDTGADKYVALILLFFLISFFIFRFIKSRINQKIILSQLKQLKTKSVKQAFVGTEISLIEMVLKASIGLNKTEIYEINHVLGIKDKNIGLQKKVRSDVINGINEKYQIITSSPYPLIVSERKEDDKRFLAYYILPSEIREINKILLKINSGN